MLPLSLNESTKAPFSRNVCVVFFWLTVVRVVRPRSRELPRLCYHSWVPKHLLNDWHHSWCTYDVFVGVRMTSLPVFRQTFGYSTLQNCRICNHNFFLYFFKWIDIIWFLLDPCKFFLITPVPYLLLLIWGYVIKCQSTHNCQLCKSHNFFTDDNHSQNFYVSTLQIFTVVL